MMRPQSSASFLPLLLLPVLGPALNAQSEEADLAWTKSHVVVAYNPVRFGRHKLSELPVGGEWRMGMNTASTLTTDVPLVGESGLVAPGSYRANIRRQSEEEFGLQVVSTQLATGGDQAYFPTELETAKSADKLEIGWVRSTGGKKATRKKNGRAKTGTPKQNPPPGGKPSDAAQPRGTQAPAVDAIDGKHSQRATLRLSFGTYRLDMPIAMVGGRPVKVRGFKGTAFTWPDALFRQQLEKGQAVPVLTLRAKGGSKSRPVMFNLLITEKKAAFYPAMAAPTESFGFAGVKGFDAGEILEGTIEWSASQGTAAFLAARDVKVKKRELRLTIEVGKRIAKVVVPMPRAKK